MSRRLALLTAASPARTVDVGFCASDGSGFFLEQPADHLERWNLPYDNGSHLVIDWRPDRRVCGRNVSSYFVDVSTSVPVLSFFARIFGSFPQDICAPGGSKARDAVDIEESVEAACAPYPPASDGCQSERQTSFAIPAALRTLSSWDVEVTVRGYGSHAAVGDAKGAPPTDCTWWCHKYRRAAPVGAGGAGRRRRRRRRALDHAAAAAAAARAGSAACGSGWVGGQVGHRSPNYSENT